MPDLDAIRGREQKATKGPWCNPVQGNVVAGNPPALIVSVPRPKGGEATRRRDADAAFIAHAREDIPALLDAISAAEANAATRVARHEYDRVLAALAAAEARADAAERERDAALAGARENADWAGAAEAAMKAAEARADAAERRADAAEKAEPMQPIVVAADGMIRFRENKLVRWLLDAGGLDMNDLARFAIEADVPQRDREQFAQLIGYSISGYSELSYVSDESYNRAEEMAGPLHAALASGEGETATRTGDPRPDGSGQG